MSGESGGTVPPSAREALLERIVTELSVRSGPVTVRGLAAALRISHRTILHHFGSRTGVIEAVADELAAEQSRALDLLTDLSVPPGQRLEATWQALVVASEAHGALYFQLTTQLMHRRPGCGSSDLGLRDVRRWVDALEKAWAEAGIASSATAAHARLDLAVIRGALHDLLLTRERGEVDAVMSRFSTLSGVDPTTRGYVPCGTSARERGRP